MTVNGKRAGMSRETVNSWHQIILDSDNLKEFFQLVEWTLSWKTGANDFCKSLVNKFVCGENFLTVYIYI